MLTSDPSEVHIGRSKDAIRQLGGILGVDLLKKDAISKL